MEPDSAPEYEVNTTIRYEERSVRPASMEARRRVILRVVYLDGDWCVADFVEDGADVSDDGTSGGS